MKECGIRVTLAFAQSLDGRIATKTGESQWISGDETLALAQELRKDHDAVAVGINTVLRDDPLLTCRLAGCRNPLRVVFDSRLRLPPACRIAETASGVDTLVFCDAEALAGSETRLKRDVLLRLGIRIQGIPRTLGDPAVNMGLSLRDGLEALSQSGIRSLLVEGGAGLLTAFLLSGCTKKIVVVTAPLFIGRGVEAFGDLGIEKLSDALRPKQAAARLLGRDVVWELEL